MITYKQITTADPEYASEKDLRNRVLRLPLGLVLSEDDVRGEDSQIHWVAADDGGRVVGCVLLAFPGGGTADLRQMAVDPACRGRRIGAGLMERAERTARERKLSKVTLCARLFARGFYERLGYRALGKVFTAVTIPHIRMEKEL
ncbi:MAG: GNAT family N-acetyltransferase [Anaerolineales bacterium]|nr:GNAT family N-acetyltransferase [Anaerolineales bacterium]